MDKIEIPESVVKTALIQSEIPYNHKVVKSLTRLLNVNMNYYLEKKDRENKVCWWEVSQNNSGGFFIDNDDVCEILLIQAESKGDAEKRLWEIVRDYSDYCYCCGERWWGVSEGFVSIEEYKEKYYRSSFRNKAMIYPKNGNHYIENLGERNE